jgi:ketosteroid isomerase-like protein
LAQALIARLQSGWVMLEVRDERRNAMSKDERAQQPEDLTRLFVERANDGDAAGIAELYETEAVMAYPPGQMTIGRDAIRALWEKVLSSRPHLEQEAPLPTLISGDIALTSTPPKDAAGARAQVARRQPDGTWLRLLDQPEFVAVIR